MEESTKNNIGSGITALLTIVLFGFGLVRGIDAWLTIEQIQATGPVGQAVFREEAQSAKAGLLTAGGAVLGGIFTLGLAVSFEIKAELWRMRED
ncbi:hypothetical protein [Halosimplex halobium]|uniref:hypothetical protein n=1 Tax=Halosimplex halobium TaxID=3396618 RepID=UPI003F55328C